MQSLLPHQDKNINKNPYHRTQRHTLSAKNYNKNASCSNVVLKTYCNHNDSQSVYKNPFECFVYFR